MIKPPGELSIRETSHGTSVRRDDEGRGPAIDEGTERDAEQFRRRLQEAQQRRSFGDESERSGPSGGGPDSAGGQAELRVIGRANGPAGPSSDSADAAKAGRERLPDPAQAGRGPLASTVQSLTSTTDGPTGSRSGKEAGGSGIGTAPSPRSGASSAPARSEQSQSMDRQRMDANMPPVDGLAVAAVRRGGRQMGAAEQRMGKPEDAVSAVTLPEMATAQRGEAILMSMTGNRPGTEAASGDQQRLAVYQAVGRAVERLIVTDSSIAQRQEIHLKLRDDFLPGVELRVFRDGGELRINFVAASPESIAWLQENRDSIRAELRSELREDVAVSVERSKGAEDQDSRGEERSDRRSRGYRSYEAEE
jgi:hypothetical protein